MKGYMNKVINVNLSTETIESIQYDDNLLKKYIGGSGLATKILWDRKIYEVEPLSPENLLIFMTGPFANTPALTSGRHTVVTKSPSTGMFAESDAGGRWGGTLKRAGFDGIIVEGCAKEPVYLWVSEGNVEIRKANHLWGKDVFATDELIKAETNQKAVTACIGQGGENLCWMASIINDGKSARASGRCGTGAVMGSKKLKAIAVHGSIKTDIYDKAGLQSSVRNIAKQAREKLAGLTTHGTSGGLFSFEEMGTLPLQNWKGRERWTEGAQAITGATMTEKAFTGNYGCEGCVVRCGREIRVEDDRYGTIEGAGPEYETLAGFGSLCLVSDLNAILKANDLCNRYGIDTISTSACVSFAMEAFERGILTTDDTDGLDLTWGNAEAMVTLVEWIAEKKGIGAVLAKGVRKAAQTIGKGSEEYAIHSHGLEFPLHDPRGYMTCSIEYAMSARGACHMSGVTHGFERALTMPEVGLKEVPDRLSTDKKGELTAKAQNVVGLFDSLKACKLMMFAGVTLTDLLTWYNCITGETVSMDEFVKTGERTYNLKRLFNLQCGIHPEEDKVPDRILTLPKDAEGWGTKLPPFEEMRDEYYKTQEWDEKGFPTRSTLEKLGLQEEMETYFGTAE